VNSGFCRAADENCATVPF